MEVAPIAPTYLSPEMQKKWLENTKEYGDPVYLRPFWFWPDSWNDKGSRNYCHPFQFGTNSSQILACATWMKKEPGDFVFGHSPVYIEDFYGPRVDPIEDIEDLTDPAVREAEQERERIQDIAEEKAQAIRLYNKVLYGVVAATLVGVGVRIYMVRKRNK